MIFSSFCIEIYKGIIYFNSAYSVYLNVKFKCREKNIKIISSSYFSNLYELLLTIIYLICIYIDLSLDYIDNCASQ